MEGEGTRVLIAPEAESYVENLKCFPLHELGSSGWAQQHEYMEKLNMQAVINATSNEDEYVKEFLISHDKITMLIEEMITTEVWKQKVFPEFLEHDLEPKITFPMYIVLYHEATIANLLETILYHTSACEGAGDLIIDLIDYCYRNLTQLVSRAESNEEEEEEEITATQTERTSLDELERQDEKLRFEIGIKTLSILRYIIDNAKVLPLSALNRILNTHDIPQLLVALVENPPWTRESKGVLKKYVDNKWQVVPSDDRYRLTKVEGQVWLALFTLLLDGECQNKYEYNDYKKNVILRLRAFLNEMLVDQLPVLGHLQRYLEELAIMEPPSSTRALVLEQLPEIRENLLRQYEGKWLKLAKKQHKAYFSSSKADIRAQAQRFSEMYNFDMLESLITEPPKCALCGEAASKRCSRCQNEWYCRRECQVSHWKKHKPACDLLLGTLTELQKKEGGKATS